jgi:FkbM family methyltransferase
MRRIGPSLILALSGAFVNVEALRSQPPAGGKVSLVEVIETGDRANLQHRLSSDPLVQNLFKEKRNISVIVVGANDGSGQQSNDPLIDGLSSSNVRALMVEPNPPVFKKLETNLKTFPDSTRLQPLNVAICPDKKGEVPFYVISSRLKSQCPEAPRWAFDELSSMDSSLITKYWYYLWKCGFKREDDFRAFVDEIQVPCWTPKDVMRLDHFGPHQIDFLMVDAEGFDAKIVTAFMSHPDFNPKILVYEHKHLPQAEADTLVALLKKRGYDMRVITEDKQLSNTIAWKQ